MAATRAVEDTPAVEATREVEVVDTVVVRVNRSLIFPRISFANITRRRWRLRQPAAGTFSPITCFEKY